jgi:carboxylesterase type B
MTAPLIRTALRHSHFKKRTFLYEFAYGTERGDYPANLGCVHGDDLSYLFGAPLVPGMQLSAFNNNFNKHETALSELSISYISNFVRSG